jgi:hypothetical protein
LQFLEKNRPTANKVTKKIVVIRGNTITPVLNPMVIAPNTILQIHEDFARFGRTLTATLPF